jgi:hypothetical protein
MFSSECRRMILLVLTPRHNFGDRPNLGNKEEVEDQGAISSGRRAKVWSEIPCLSRRGRRSYDDTSKYKPLMRILMLLKLC